MATVWFMTVRFGRFSPKKSKSSAKVVAKVKLSQEARSRLLYHFMQFPQLVPFPLVPFSMQFHSFPQTSTNKEVGHAPPGEKKLEFAKIWLKYFVLAKNGRFKIKYIVCSKPMYHYMYIYNYIYIRSITVFNIVRIHTSLRTYWKMMVAMLSSLMFGIQSRKTWWMNYMKIYTVNIHTYTYPQTMVLLVDTFCVNVIY